jgi:hypothetical protein
LTKRASFVECKSQFKQQVHFIHENLKETTFIKPEAPIFFPPYTLVHSFGDEEYVCLSVVNYQKEYEKLERLAQAQNTQVDPAEYNLKKAEVDKKFIGFGNKQSRAIKDKQEFGEKYAIDKKLLKKNILDNLLLISITRSVFSGSGPLGERETDVFLF